MSDKEKFTIEQIRNYILSQESLGDVLYNLNSENIHKAKVPHLEPSSKIIDWFTKLFEESSGETIEEIEVDLTDKIYQKGVFIEFSINLGRFGIHGRNRVRVIFDTDDANSADIDIILCEYFESGSLPDELEEVISKDILSGTFQDITGLELTY